MPGGERRGEKGVGGAPGEGRPRGQPSVGLLIGWGDPNPLVERRGLVKRQKRPSSGEARLLGLLRLGSGKFVPFAERRGLG